MQPERSQQPARAKSQTRLRPSTQVTAVDRRRFPVLGYGKTTNGRPDQGNFPAAPINVPSLPNSSTTYKPAGSTTFSPDFTPSLLFLYSLPLHSPPPLRCCCPDFGYGLVTDSTQRLYPCCGPTPEPCQSVHNVYSSMQLGVATGRLAVGIVVDVVPCRRVA